MTIKTVEPTRAEWTSDAGEIAVLKKIMLSCEYS